MGDKSAQDQANLYAKRKADATIEEEVIAKYIGEVASELGLGNILRESTLDRAGAKAKSAVGMSDNNRNLSRRLISAAAQYTRAKNAQARKSAAEAERAKRAEQKQAKKADQKKKASETETKKKAFRDFVPKKLNEILNMLDKVRKGEHKDSDKVYFDNVSDEIADMIFEETGINVRGFKVAIEARQLEHILKRHGENGQADHSMANDTDIAKMEFVLKNPDDITKAGKTKAYLYMKDGKNRTADTVLYEKNIGDKTYYVVQAVPDAKAKTLYVVTAYMGNDKKIETSQTADAYHGTPSVTSENGSAIVSDTIITDSAEKSNPKNTKSQTTEKKAGKRSKVKTADTVYKKKTKLKVGDTVGEVTLVADPETGEPMTPRLRASFDTADMPSFIMAAIEAQGDTELISTLEDEMAVMLMDENAELQYHDAIEELSEYVKDGEITPEQAVQILSDELANHTGADVATLVSLMADNGVRYSLENIDNFDISWYNEIKIPAVELSRLQSEVMTWDNQHHNELRRRTLSNGYTYVYLLDETGIVHVFDRTKSTNIHERRGEYDNTSREKPDRFAEEFGLRQGDDGRFSDIGKNGREHVSTRSRNLETLRAEGDSDRTGYTENDPYAYGRTEEEQRRIDEADYRIAVERGDIETAQWYVDEAALGTGYKMPKGSGMYATKPSAPDKLAAYATYDNDGRLIPLSQRFGESISDIRYSLAAPDTFPAVDQKARAENNTDFDDNGMRYSLESSAYSYDTLTRKKDMWVTKLSDDIPTNEEGKIDRKSIIARGRLNARSQNNKKNTPTETYVYVPDIDVDVLIRKDGLEHGLSRNDEDTPLATMQIGDLLKSSIAVNELNGRTNGKRSTEMAYVLLAVGQNKNSPYLVRTIVDKTTNSVMEISTYGLYAIKAKKEGALFMSEDNEAVGDNRSYPFLRSTISISDLFENVKKDPIANEIFSDDVLKKIGVSRTEGTLSPDIRYSLVAPDTFPAVDQKARAENIVRLAEGLQSVAQSSTEYEALDRVKKNADKIVNKYDELNKLRAELKDVSFAEGPRDTARIETLTAEIESVNRSLNSYERALSNIRTTAPFKDMMQRKIQSSTAKVRREYYEKRKVKQYLVSGNKIQMFELLQPISEEKAYEWYNNALMAVRSRAFMLDTPIEYLQPEAMRELANTHLEVVFYEIV